MPLNLSTQQRTLSMPGAPEIADVATASIICGSGGSGKSMLMRHLLVSTIESQVKTPIFMELRQLNQDTRSVRNSLLKSLQTNGLDVDDTYFELALEAGHFCILLDGFDELELAIQEETANEIKLLSEKYPGNWMVVSSRPDSALQGWSDFTQFQVDPMDLERAIELVNKLPFDDPVKDKFVSDLRDGLFERHISFLSNPLLLSIMLLTYGDIAHIPDKLSIFYNQAYEALFQKHDALKGGFQRDRRTGLDIQDFAKVFSAFCVQSYDRREFSFSQTKALEYLERAKLLSQVAYEGSSFLDDALQAVCLLLEDGLDITFAHRSFQEYFVARFIQSRPPDVKKDLVERFGDQTGSDSVMSLLNELDPYAVEKYYVLPAIDDLRTQIGIRKSLGITHYLRFLKYVFSYVESPGEMRFSIGIGNSPVYKAMDFTNQNFQVRTNHIKWTNRSQLDISQILENECGFGQKLATKALKTTSPVVRALSTDRGSWGMSYLQRFLDAGDMIRQRHDQQKASLDEILLGSSGDTRMLLTNTDFRITRL